MEDIVTLSDSEPSDIEVSDDDDYEEKPPQPYQYCRDTECSCRGGEDLVFYLRARRWKNVATSDQKPRTIAIADPLFHMPPFTISHEQPSEQNAADEDDNHKQNDESSESTQENLESEKET